MSVALAGRSPSTFDLKSANLPLLALRLKSSELDVLADELQAQYGDMPDFFEDDGVVLDLAQLPADQAEAVIDFQRVGELLHERRLRLLAVRGGSAQQQADARALGLLLRAAAAHRQQAQAAFVKQLAHALEVDDGLGLLGRQLGQVEHHTIVLEEVGHVAVLRLQFFGQHVQFA